MQYLGNVLPSTQGIQMFIQLNQMGVPTALILPKLLYLFVFGIACAAFAYWRLKRR
jgi:ABC-2 type transport system permease protein